LNLVPVPTHRGTPSTLATDLSGTDLAGEATRLTVTGPRAWTLLVFLSAGCDGCKDIWAALGDPRLSGLATDERVVAVVRERDDVAALTALAPPSAEVIRSDAAWRDYRVQGPPFFTLVEGARPNVATEGVAWGVAQVAEAVRHARARPAVPG
jgi:hypothetical protein